MMNPLTLSETEADHKDGKPHFSIAQLAKEFGLTHRSIRFYEDQGLITPARSGLMRVYSYRDRARLALICRGKRLGFSVAEIRDFLNLYEAGNHGQSEQMRYALSRTRDRIGTLERQLEDVKTTITELRGIESAIARYLDNTTDNRAAAHGA